MLEPAKYKSTEVFTIKDKRSISETFYWCAFQKYEGFNYAVVCYEGTLLYADSRCNCAVRSINTI